MRIPCILFFHGLLGTSADWEPVASYLPDFFCCAIDLPGHGSTPFTEQFFEKIPHFKEPIHLVGYSMGGRLAMQYAALHPERIASLTIASAHFGLTDPREKEKQWKKDLSWAKEFIENPIDDALRRWYDQPLFQTFQADFSMRRKQNIEEMVKALLHFSLANQPYMQPKHALYLVGEYDDKYRSLYASVAHHVIPNAGHAVHLENPQAIADAIRSYICSLGKTAKNTKTSAIKN